MFPVVIATGDDSGENMLDFVELVDNHTNCNVDPFPIRLSNAVGINGMVCGGRDYELNVISSCWYLNPSGKWAVGDDMLDSRMHFSLSNIEDETIAIGGIGYRTGYWIYDHDYHLSSIEKHSDRKYGGWSWMTDAPITIAKQCVVVINKLVLFVIGGEQDYQVNSNQH